MIPVFSGRVQTRFFLLSTVGLPWTLLIGWLLPRPAGASVLQAYGVLLLSLVIVGVVGIAWDFVYIALQQYRWEKDWPTLFALLTGIPECITTYLVLRLLGFLFGFSVDTAAFLILFTTMWVLMWLVAVGPIKVFLPRWRYNGGRIT